MAWARHSRALDANAEWANPAPPPVPRPILAMRVSLRVGELQCPKGSAKGRGPHGEKEANRRRLDRRNPGRHSVGAKGSLDRLGGRTCGGHCRLALGEVAGNAPERATLSRQAGPRSRADIGPVDQGIRSSIWAGGTETAPARSCPTGGSGKYRIGHLLEVGRHCRVRRCVPGRL